MLNGKHGILPCADLMQRVRTVYGEEGFFYLPSLFWFNSSDPFLLGVCIAGTIISLFVLAGILTGPSLIVLTILWLSLVNGCGEFTGFQSDGLLVEASVLSLFLVPWCLIEPPLSCMVRGTGAQQKEPSGLSIFLIRFLLFRLMFAAGVVKIISGDPTWQDLTALSYHQ